MARIETDYLIIGSGAVGLAFADTLLDETDAHITLVDRHGKPGGHWNDAYSFVALHQPSAFYGVNSMPLGADRIDTVGVNKGYYELASGPEVSGYFDRVMNQKLLPSGRVSYHPMCDYIGDGRFVSLLSGAWACGCSTPARRPRPSAGSCRVTPGWSTARAPSPAWHFSRKAWAARPR